MNEQTLGRLHESRVLSLPRRKDRPILMGPNLFPFTGAEHMAGLYLKSEELASLAASADGHQLLKAAAMMGDDVLRFTPLLPWMSNVVSRLMAYDPILGCALPDIYEWKLNEARYYDRRLSTPSMVTLDDAAVSLESKISFVHGTGDADDPHFDLYQIVSFVPNKAGSFAPYFSYLMHYFDRKTSVSVVAPVPPVLRREHATLAVPTQGGNVVWLAIAADLLAREDIISIPRLECLGNRILDFSSARTAAPPSRSEDE